MINTHSLAASQRTILSCVHTWCPSTCARAPAQNGAVYPISWCTRYPISWCPVQCPSTRSRPCTRARALCPNSGVGTWKKCVFTLVPIKNRSRAPYSGTKCERSLISSCLIWGLRYPSGDAEHRHPWDTQYSRPSINPTVFLVPILSWLFIGYADYETYLVNNKNNICLSTMCPIGTVLLDPLRSFLT